MMRHQMRCVPGAFGRADRAQSIATSTAARNELMTRPVRSNRHLVALALALCFTAAACIPGQKLLDLSVARDGHVLAEIQFAVPDSSDVDAMWAAAGKRPLVGALVLDTLSPADAPTAEQPLHTLLRGPVVLSLTHTNSVESRVTLHSVRLQRSDAGSVDWRLSAYDVARAQQAALR